ncbi:MAG TPA: enoyl-CoA hydratase/isomerase family protein [Acidimicrobiia bacterium]|nr:enoyl-CoA hydratase/isomerase family protein [Acidimicrobiia bacterium]
MSWLHIDDRGAVRWLTIDRPDRKNAIPFEGWPELEAALAAFQASGQRVLVVTGAGGEFCAGADLDPARLDRLQSVEDRHARMKLVGAAAMALHRLTKPTIAAVDGVAVGAGMNLALGCDVVVATERARFSEIFVKRGLTVDFGGSWLLPRIVGLQRAKELALSGRMVGAEEAARLGLVAEVVAVETLEDRVTEMAATFLDGAPLAQMFAKQTINASFQIGLADALSWEGEAQSVALGTEDAIEGVLAFLEKRAPEWKGK